MRLNYIARHFDPCDGYGSWAGDKIRSLTRKGIYAVPVMLEATEMPGWLQRLAGIDFSGLNIATTRPEIMPSLPGRLWADTMCEDTDLWEGAADALNERCERVIVPCPHNAEVFKTRGVRIPIHVVSGGINPAELPVIEHFPERPFTFMCLGDRGSRKGMDLVWSAFFRAFAEVRDVRLIVKMRAGNGWDVLTQATFPDHRISIWREDVAQRSDIYAHADCFVFPSKGEGWGLPPREAAAMGIPTLATRWSGLEVGIDHWAIPLERFHLARSQMGTPAGEWAVVELDELIEKMRWVYEHRDEARTNALKSATWLRKNQTWDHSVEQLLTLIREHSSWLS